MPDANVQPWDPEYAKEEPQGDFATDDEDPWFAEMSLLGMFKSHKTPYSQPAVANSSSAAKDNEFVSVFNSGGFVDFYRMYNAHGKSHRESLMAKYKKAKLD